MIQLKTNSYGTNYWSTSILRKEVVDIERIGVRWRSNMK